MWYSHANIEAILTSKVLSCSYTLQHISTLQKEKKEEKKMMNKKRIDYSTYKKRVVAFLSIQPKINSYNRENISHFIFKLIIILLQTKVFEQSNRGKAEKA